MRRAWPLPMRRASVPRMAALTWFGFGLGLGLGLRLGLGLVLGLGLGSRREPPSNSAFSLKVYL